MLAWLAGFSIRQYLEAAAVAALFVFILYWDHLKIQEGRDEVRAEDAAELAKVQGKLAALQDPNNPLNLRRIEIQHEIDRVVPPLPVTGSDDCAPISLPDVVRSTRRTH